ncbi:hypothetical protein BDR03DRAFT_987673 [Suillus americanus]|nr:hypothetical protein BDR03DRAFT_987673 [Suillus americanus]
MPPRFKYNLQGLDPKEKQAEQKRRWLARQMEDPESAERIRAQNRASKRAQRHREKKKKFNDSESPDQSAQPPLFRRKRPSTPSPEVPSVQPSTPTVPRSTFIDNNLIDPVLRSPVPPRRMVDANVMTDPPQRIPDTIHPLSPLNLDFTPGILGIEVPQQSGTVTWADGRRTVLPCVMSKGINICENNDAAMVRFLSEFPESKPTSNDVVHLKRHGLTRGQLEKSISEALSHNKPVIIRGSSSNSASVLDVEYLQNNFGISPLMRVTMHDVAKRVKDFTHPHKQGTIQRFMDDTGDPSKIQCILDIPLSHAGLPPELQLLDHGLVYGWNQTTVDCPVRSGKVHPDNFTTKSWALLHQAGFVSYPHHDADGAITFVRVETGIKFWVVFRPKHTLGRTALQKAQMLFSNFSKNREEIMLTWDAEVITLLDGDLLFQPAGQIHAVYTPKKSFVTGGHLHHFGSLHLTELSRYIDAHKAQFLTNQVHDNALETFQRMTIALPRLSPSIELHRRALVGLCLMVINRDKYKASNNDQGYKIIASESTERAVVIATAIIRHFYQDAATAQRSYRSGDQSDPVYDIQQTCRTCALMKTLTDIIFFRTWNIRALNSESQRQGIVLLVVWYKYLGSALLQFMYYFYKTGARLKRMNSETGGKRRTSVSKVSCVELPNMSSGKLTGKFITTAISVTSSSLRTQSGTVEGAVLGGISNGQNVDSGKYAQHKRLKKRLGSPSGQSLKSVKCQLSSGIFLIILRLLFFYTRAGHLSRSLDMKFVGTHRVFIKNLSVRLVEKKMHLMSPMLCRVY